MKECKQYSLVDIKTQFVVLCTRENRELFIREGIKQLKARLFSKYVYGEKRYSDEKELFEEIDRLKKIKDNIVILEQNSPHKVSDEVRLLNAIAEMLDIEVQVEKIATTD